ncbi:hypothetical protein MJG53_009241 [Ovis ammon polii x Ovis aries]|uniref:Uncharacterized protein n=1 Tax=Ovis ammon polii x Ovis aries TaxID=2918886 RepID=A0ACB9UVS0_9CETA|nr:hypothetical protein MJG53_009241 [Ovis ammon polii x Ovis aries]
MGGGRAKGRRRIISRVISPSAPSTDSGRSGAPGASARRPARMGPSRGVGCALRLRTGARSAGGPGQRAESVTTPSAQVGALACNIFSVLSAPYEICPEDYLMSMVWKRTPAGDLAFNQCPMNATGKWRLISSRGVRASHCDGSSLLWSRGSRAHGLQSLEQIKEHLAKGQRMLAGDGMSQVTKTLLDLTQRKNFYAGDLLMSVEILRNVTDTFKRASYIPASDGVQNFFQIVSNLLDEDNKEKWEDAQQIYPGSIELMQVIEDFIHIVGMGMMDFQNSYLMTGNVVASIQKLPAASVLTDINFPMKGRKGMVDWARNSEDRVVIPKSIFTPVSSKELDESSVFVLGAVLYKNLDLILPTLRNYTVVNSKIIVVTIRPEPKTTDSFLEIELAHLANLKPKAFAD